MSLREPNLPTPNDHVRHFLDRLTREARDTGRSAFPYAELCSRAGIPRDLREKLLVNLLREKYVSREGDLVRITPAGTKHAGSPVTQSPPVDKADNPSPFDRESRIRTPGSGTRRHP
jgi:DNA-binding IclR family transcriptional regulator